MSRSWQRAAVIRNALPIDNQGVWRNLRHRAIRQDVAGRFRCHSSSRSSSAHRGGPGPIAIYEQLVARGEVIDDPCQRAALVHFEHLHDVISQLDKPEVPSAAVAVEAPAVPSVHIQQPLTEPISSASNAPPTAHSNSRQTEVHSSSTSGGVSGWMASLFGSNKAPSVQTQPTKAAAVPVAASAPVATAAPNQSHNYYRSGSRRGNALKGLYLYGGTGCGKTYLMDLFFHNLNIKRKKRVHFHNFMIDVHKRLHRLKMQSNATTTSTGPHRSMSRSGQQHQHQHQQSSDVIAAVTEELLADAYVLCFDEFQVTDIADAMILKSLFTTMLDAGVVLVATSNRPPQDLYKNGLQRSLFLPFIDFLQARCIVHSMYTPAAVDGDSGNDTTAAVATSIDYRVLKHEQLAKHAYLYPSNDAHARLFDAQFAQMRLLSNNGVLASEMPSSPDSVSTIDLNNTLLPIHRIQLAVYGHSVEVPNAVLGRRIALFDFAELCDTALGAVDYIELGKVFQVVFLKNVPAMNLTNRNVLRRFINCIDAFYEDCVRIVVLADVGPNDLLKLTAEEKEQAGFDEVFAFDRTVSRLLEMQSKPYLQSSLEQHPQGPDFVEVAIFDTDAPSTATLLLEQPLSTATLKQLWGYYYIPTAEDSLGGIEAVTPAVAEVAMRDLWTVVGRKDVEQLRKQLRRFGIIAVDSEETNSGDPVDLVRTADITCVLKQCMSVDVAACEDSLAKALTAEQFGRLLQIVWRG